MSQPGHKPQVSKTSYADSRILASLHFTRLDLWNRTSLPQSLRVLCPTLHKQEKQKRFLHLFLCREGLVGGTVLRQGNGAASLRCFASPSRVGGSWLG